jgi:glycosyltransferase involved in cell wall biosynthesis
MAMLAGLRYAKRKGKPLVVTWHGDWLGATKIRKLFALALNKTLVRSCLSQADVIIVPSAEYVDESNVLRKYRRKVVEIPHGIDLEEMKVPYSKEDSRKMLGLSDELIVLYVGMINEGKGVGVLLRAAQKVLARNRDVRFLFVGGGRVSSRISQKG